jgi:hypothetical protein
LDSSFSTRYINDFGGNVRCKLLIAHEKPDQEISSSSNVTEPVLSSSLADENFFFQEEGVGEKYRHMIDSSSSLHLLPQLK